MEDVLEKGIHRVHHLIWFVGLILMMTVVGRCQASPLLVILTSYPLATHSWIVQRVLYLKAIATVSVAVSFLPFGIVDICSMSVGRRIAFITDSVWREESLIAFTLVLARLLSVLAAAVDSVLTLAPEKEMQVAHFVIPWRF